MSRAGRNDPCPCGSGQKYKKCCLERHQGIDRVHEAIGRGLGRAAEWIEEHHPDELTRLLEGGFYGSLGGAVDEAFGGLPDEERSFLENNAVEWVVAEGAREVEGGEVALIAEVLGDPEVELTAQERRFLEQIAVAPLHLYAVEEVAAAKGFRVRDLIVPDAAAMFVEDADAHPELTDSVLGLRLVGDGPWYASGALYPFPDEEGLQLAEEIGAELLEAESARTPRELCGSWIVEAWLEGVAEELGVDEHSGDEQPETVDLYELVGGDWEPLQQVLEDREDVAPIGGEDGWVRIEPEEDGGVRVRVALYRDEGSSLAVSGAEEEVDAAREWLESIAAGRLRFHQRID